MVGYLLPGFPIANLVFRLYSAESVAQGLAFLRDFKLGQYMKIAPREMLAVQVHFIPRVHIYPFLALLGFYCIEPKIGVVSSGMKSKLCPPHSLKGVHKLFKPLRQPQRNINKTTIFIR